LVKPLHVLSVRNQPKKIKVVIETVTSKL